MYTYIVSGFLRTGTSMMMKACVAASGLEPVYSTKPDEMNDRYGDEHYKPNEGGFYETGRQTRGMLGFPKQHEGKIIKVFHMGLPRLAVMNYKVVFMRRHPEEIRQSLQAMEDRPVPHAVMKTLNNYDAIMDHSEEMARNRRDMQVTAFHYRKVIAEPLKHMQILVDAGWKIDPYRAAEVVEKERCRFKLEELTVGI